MTGRLYRAQFSLISISAIQDIWELNCPSDAVVEVLSMQIGQVSDLVDANAENLAIQISKAPTASGSGGAPVTPVAGMSGGAAFGGTVERNNTTQATGTVQGETLIWNIALEYLYAPIPEERVWLSPSERLVFELPVAPGSALVCYSTLRFRAYGG